MAFRGHARTREELCGHITTDVLPPPVSRPENGRDQREKKTGYNDANIPHKIRFLFLLRLAQTRVHYY